MCIRDRGYPDAAKEWLDRGKSRYAEDEEYMALTADYLASTHQVESAIIYYNKLIDKFLFRIRRGTMSLDTTRSAC